MKEIHTEDLKNIHGGNWVTAITTLLLTLIPVLPNKGEDDDIKESRDKS